MRTTLTIDDELARQLKKLAQETDRSFKDVVNQALRAGLAQSPEQPAYRPYRTQPVSMGPVMPGIDLNQALALAGALEDEELARKLEQRK